MFTECPCYNLCEVPDLYEADRVLVQPSTIPGANDGLFARRALAKGEVVSFYNGLRRPPARETCQGLSSAAFRRL